MSYRLSRQATLDLLEIYKSGHQEFGEAQADRYHAGLERVFDLISSNPRLARLRVEIPNPARIHRYGAHVIVYSVDENDNILIIRVRHGREDWTADPAGRE